MDKPKKIAALVTLGALVVVGVLVVVLNANTSDSTGQPVQAVAASATTSPSITYPQCADFATSTFIGQPATSSMTSLPTGWSVSYVNATDPSAAPPKVLGATIMSVSKLQFRCEVVFSLVAASNHATVVAPVITPESSPDTPPGPLTTVSSGTYLVGTDMEPGSYKSPGSSRGCYWARLKDDAGQNIIANDLVSGPGPARFTAKKGEYVKVSLCTFTKI